MKAKKSRAALRDASRPGQATANDQGEHGALGTAADRSRLQWALEAFVRSTRALIHFKDVEELVDQVCEAIVQDGRYLIAAVGLTASAKESMVA